MQNYDGGVVADQATGRPLMGQNVKVFDEETDAPVQVYREGIPVNLVTGAHGLIPQFQTEDSTRRVRLEVGPVRLRQWCQEMIASAAAAGDDISSALEQVEVVRAEAAAIVPRMEQIEVMAGLAPGDVTDAQTANLIAQPDTLSRDALSAAIAEPGISTTFRSSTDPLADTLRSRYVSYQKQEPENGYNGGEPLWFDTAPLAKNMLTWRIPMDWATRTVKPAHAGPFADSDWQRVVWAGAHWYAQDQPEDANPTVIHGHWSVETPVPSGELHTRFQVFFNDRADPSKVGADVALISTNRADFLVDRQTTPGGAEGGRFILSGSHALDRMVEFNRSLGDGPSGGGDKAAARRWAAGITGQTETGNNAGGNFTVRRHDDAGSLLGTALFIKRDTGRITLGSDAWIPDTQPSTVMVTTPGAGVSGILVNPSANLAGGAAFNARLRAWDDTLLRSQIGSAPPRFEISAYGVVKWQNGSGLTTGTLEVVNGALRYTGSSGTVTTIAPA